MPLLEVDNLDVFYGAIHALKGLSLSVDEGEIVTLIGANGAGKSTTLKTISGLLRPRGGAIRFAGQEISRTPPDQVVAMGLSQAPEGRRIFQNMTVRENLDLGAFTRRDPGGIRKDLEEVLTLFPRLKERLSQQAGTLSGGEQQMLALGRAPVARSPPAVLVEPAAGFAPFLVEENCPVL